MSRSSRGDINAEVRNNPAEYRYEVWVDDGLAGYTQYVLRPGRIAFVHTEVYESYGGMGLGGRLARAALDDARARGLVVMPFCPFIAAYIERHLDEYGDLVAPEMLTGDRDHDPEAATTRNRLEQKEQSTMSTQIETGEREVVLLEDAHIRPMMGLDVLEPLPSRTIPYSRVDPFILVHEAVVPITEERASMDTRHPHRGFDNLWYLLAGEASTGHSTGPGGAMERARLRTGSLLKLRTGRGVWHAEGIGEDEVREGKAGSEMRGVLFWVNLARKDKGVEPSAQILNPQDVPVRQDGDAIVRALVGDGSPVELGTPGLILDVELPMGGSFHHSVPPEFNGFVYMLEGEASFGANTRRASRSQIAVLGAGGALSVVDAQPGTRFMLMAGKPYGETPFFNGPYVD